MGALDGNGKIIFLADLADFADFLFLTQTYFILIALRSFIFRSRVVLKNL